MNLEGWEIGGTINGERTFGERVSGSRGTGDLLYIECEKTRDQAVVADTTLVLKGTAGLEGTRVELLA